MSRALKFAVALALVLTMTSCARASIEEMGRTAIRERAAEGKNWFIKFTEATDTANRELVASRLAGVGDPYSFGWDSEGDFHTDHYYREHLTTSGGWWAEQRTVSACVRRRSELQRAVVAGEITRIRRAELPPAVLADQSSSDSVGRGR